MSHTPSRAELEDFWDDDLDRQRVSKPEDLYRLFVSLDRTVLVRWWTTGVMEVCTRETEGAIWGPPVELSEERTS